MKLLVTYPTGKQAVMSQETALFALQEDYGELFFKSKDGQVETEVYNDRRAWELGLASKIVALIEPA